MSSVESLMVGVPTKIL